MPLPMIKEPSGILELASDSLSPKAALPELRVRPEPMEVAPADMVIVPEEASRIISPELKVFSVKLLDSKDSPTSMVRAALVLMKEEV